MTTMPTEPKESRGRWLANPANQVEAELRRALDGAATRQADEVALRRIWARLSDLPGLDREAEASGGRQEGAQDAQQLSAGRGRRILWPWILAASLAGATATLALMLVEAKSGFLANRGEVSRRPQAPWGGQGESGDDPGSTVQPPGTVRTGFGETLHLSLRGGIEVIVKSESTMTLNENDRPAVLGGEVEFHVPHQPAGQRFTVMARDYRVVVVGTRFRVRVGLNDTAVGVDEGVVEIWTDRRVARVAASESWVSDGETSRAPGHTGRGVATNPVDAGTPAQSAVAGSSRSVRAVPASRKGRGPGQHAPSASASGHAPTDGPDRTAPRVLALAAPRLPGSEPWTPSSNAAPSATIATSESVVAAASDDVLDERDDVSRGGGSDLPWGRSSSPSAPADRKLVRPETPKAPRLAPNPVPADPTPLALQARGARVAGDAHRALGIYRTLAQRGGAAGEHAEYEIGAILRDSLHQPREAVSAWRAYREQHPRGLLRIEADISVVETLVAMGDTNAAMAEASDFIRRYPESERRAEMARLAGDLLRERGECGAAIRAYDVALDSAHGRREISDAATFHRSLCIGRDDESQGAASLRAYLAAFPGGRFHREAQRLLDGGAPSGMTSPP